MIFLHTFSNFNLPKFLPFGSFVGQKCRQNSNVNCHLKENLEPVDIKEQLRITEQLDSKKRQQQAANAAANAASAAAAAAAPASPNKESPKKGEGEGGKMTAAHPSDNKSDKKGAKDEKKEEGKRTPGRSLFHLDTTRSAGGDGGDEPPSPSPRTAPGGKDPMWNSTEIQNDEKAGTGGTSGSKPMPYNIKGTLERRRRIMSSSGTKSSFKFRNAGSMSAGRTPDNGGGGENSMTQMAMMEDDNMSAAITHGGGGLTLHSR